MSNIESFVSWESVQLFLVLLVFITLSFLMFLRKIPALLALPIMAFLLPIIAGVGIYDTIEFVLGMGSIKLAKAYTIAIFGSMISVLLQKTGVAENFIKKGAELAGDKPFGIAVIMLVLITVLFTTLGGLGAIIMVATVVLPIMSSVGIGPLTICGIFLFGLSIGGLLNAGNWSVYIETLKLEVNEIKSFALYMFLLTFIIAIVYITIQLYRDGREINFKKIILSFALTFIIAGFLLYLWEISSQEIKENIIQIGEQILFSLKYFIAGLIIILFILSVAYALKFLKSEKKIFWTAYFTPVIPLFLILIFNMDFIAAFICGLFFGFLATMRKGSLNLLVRSIFEGGSVVMPAVALMLGIGMLLNSIMGPGADILSKSGNYANGWPVLNLLQPFLQKIAPKNFFEYVLIFSIAAPLALYRGPLNVWGMGYGIAAILLAAGMAPGAIMGLLLAVGQIQGVSDPTNTQNVWLANEMKTDAQKILFNTLPYTWITAVIGLFIAALKYF